MVELSLRATDAITAVLKEAAGCPGLSEVCALQALCLQGNKTQWISAVGATS